MKPPEIILPSHVRAQIGADAEADETPENAEELASAMPRPVGYKILCIAPKMEQTFAGTGIIKSDETLQTEELTTHVLFVLDVGPDAYKDAAKFPTGPWCKKGDFVLVRAYAGTRFKVYGKEFRLLNDDNIDGVISDPRGVGRV